MRAIFDASWAYFSFTRLDSATELVIIVVKSCSTISIEIAGGDRGSMKEKHTGIEGAGK